MKTQRQTNEMLLMTISRQNETQRLSLPSRRTGEELQEETDTRERTKFFREPTDLIINAEHLHRSLKEKEEDFDDLHEETQTTP